MNDEGRETLESVISIPHLENNSGGGKGTILPEGVSGWSWGAFLFNWIWAPFNNSWIGLLALIPVIGLIMTIYLGVYGRELAWRNKRWESLEHFNRVQRRWSVWGIAIVGGIIILGLIVAFASPGEN